MTKPCKVFGVALDTVMQAQQITHPELEIPLVIHKLYSFIREGEKLNGSNK